MINKEIEEFNKFISNYDINNEAIKMKYNHTFRVVDYANKILVNETNDKDIVRLGLIGALLHDIARFKQWKEYETYKDAISFDHGDMAYEILKNNDYISNYVQSEEDKDIILNAVKKHNKIKLELTNDYKKDFIAMLVRDADKIDILDSHYKLTNNSLYLYRGFLDDDGKLSEKQFEISDILIEDIINHRLCSNANVKCYFDTILRELAFTFDLNFKSSFQVLLDENIIDDKIAILRKYNTKDTEKINLIEKTLKEFIDSKFKED